jgi:rubrerythrin
MAVIASENDLLRAAATLEAAAARRYRALAGWWEAQGDPALAALFDRLAAMEEEHAASVMTRWAAAPAAASAAAAGSPPASEDPAWHSALLTPYRALSLAVRAEEAAFAFYADIAAHAMAPAMRELAEDLARAELDHAAILRRARRAAFRDARMRPPPPPPADVPALTRLSAIWEAEVAAASGRAARLRALSRNAERYLAIAERTKSEAVLAAAQQQAAATLHELALERGGSEGRPRDASG